MVVTSIKRDDIMCSVLNLIGSKCSKAAIKIAKPPSLRTLAWKLAFYWAKNSVSLWSQKYTGSTSPGQRESNLWKISKLIFSKMDLRPKALSWLAPPKLLIFCSHVKLWTHFLLCLNSFLLAWQMLLLIFNCRWFFRFGCVLLFKAPLAVCVPPHIADHHFNLSNFMCNYLLYIDT